MGIYSDGRIYGLRIVKCIDEYKQELSTLFEIMDDKTPLTLEKIDDVCFYYMAHNCDNSLLYSAYQEFSTTYNEPSVTNVYKNWIGISYEKFLGIIIAQQ